MEGIDLDGKVTHEDCGLCLVCDTLALFWRETTSIESNPTANILPDGNAHEKYLFPLFSVVIKNIIRCINENKHVKNICFPMARGALICPKLERFRYR